MQNESENYELLKELDNELYHELICEFVDLAKEKGLATKQVHKLFIDCANSLSDKDLEICKNKKLHLHMSELEYLKSIAKSLDSIAQRLDWGVTTYK